MDGLECSEIRKNYIKTKTYDFRTESEFFKKEDLAILSRLENLNVATLEDGLVEIVTDGTHYTPTYVDEGIPFLSAINVKENCFNPTAGYKFISKEEHFQLCKRVHPKQGDILLRKVGVGPRWACVIPTNAFDFSIFVSVALIRSKINPYYLATYLNSKYGQLQLLRFNKGISQPDLHLEDIRKTIVPLFSNSFYGAIEDVVRKAEHSSIESFEKADEAEKYFEQILNIERINALNSAISVKRLSESFKAMGRLDAEFYQPKYDTYLIALKQFETTRIPEEFYVFKNNGTNYAEGISDVGVIKTKQLTNSGVHTDDVESYFTNEACTKNKSTFIANNDVIFASMGVGSLGKVSLFSYDGDRTFVTDSTLRIYRAKETARVLPEVLCIFLQSTIGQELIYRYVVGSTGIINIYDDDIAKIPIPVLDKEIQKDIADKVQESFALRRQSKQLLEYAKQAVEMAIEQGEDAALAWLKDKVE